MKPFTYEEELLEFISDHQKACIEFGLEFSDENHAQVISARITLIRHCLAARQTACDEVTAHFEAYTNPVAGKILADQVKEILK